MSSAQIESIIYANQRFALPNLPDGAPLPQERHVESCACPGNKQNWARGSRHSSQTCVAVLQHDFCVLTTLPPCRTAQHAHARHAAGRLVGGRRWRGQGAADRGPDKRVLAVRRPAGMAAVARLLAATICAFRVPLKNAQSALTQATLSSCAPVPRAG